MQTLSRKSLADLGHEDFRPHLNTTFTIEHQQGGTLDVERAETQRRTRSRVSPSAI